MSTFMAIHDVTNKIIEAIQQVGVTVTAKSPDKAREGITGNQLNVFLYHSAINGAWRNQDLPRPSGRGQPARPLLPLNLFYLITAYGSDSTSPQVSDLLAHRFLGRAMLNLHDHVEFQFPQPSGIKNQPEPIRITMQPLSIDEMSKLWAAFQTPYRPSITYEVGVLLIESELASPVPLPVVSRGKDEGGWDSTTQFPAAIDSVQFQTPFQPGARLGETITLVGRNLSPTGDVKIAFRHSSPNQADPLFLSPDSMSDNRLTATIPDDASHWAAGLYRVTVECTNDEHTNSSNVFPIAILPQIDLTIVPLNATRTPPLTGDDFSLDLNCKHSPLADQRIQMVIGAVSIEAKSVGTTWTAKWKKSDLPASSLVTPTVRLRVDGIESLVIDPTQKPPQLDPRLVVQGIP